MIALNKEEQSNTEFETDNLNLSFDEIEDDNPPIESMEDDGDETHDINEMFASIDYEADSASSTVNEEESSPNETSESPSKMSPLKRLLNYTDAMNKIVSMDNKVYIGGYFYHRYEVHPVNSQFIEDYLTEKYYEDTGKSLSSSESKKWQRLFSAQARRSGNRSEIYCRTAKVADAYYLDIADENGQAIKVDSSGWSFENTFNVSFVRGSSLLPTVTPEHDGSIELLRQFVRASDDDFTLLISYLIECLRPDTPKPVLYITGEAGSSKTTLMKIICELIDPSIQTVLSFPKEERDLMLAARNSWLLAYDNLSKLSPMMSDALCRISTGAGFRKRSNFKDSDEIIFKVRRPIILSGISEFISRQDLLDRCVFIQTLPMSSSNRKSESDFWSEFDAQKGQIMGALLSAFSSALTHYEATEPSFQSRMMDFVKLGCALEAGLGWQTDTFKTAFQNNRRDAMENSFEDDTVVQYIRETIGSSASWTGSSQELLDKIVQKHAKAKDIPKTPKGMSDRLRKVAGFLRESGIDVVVPKQVTWSPEKKASIRQIDISRISN